MESLTPVCGRALQEAQRLFPSVPFIGRELMEDIVVSAYCHVTVNGAELTFGRRVEHLPSSLSARAFRRPSIRV